MYIPRSISQDYDATSASRRPRAHETRMGFGYHTRELRNRYAGKLHEGVGSVRSSTTNIREDDQPDLILVYKIKPESTRRSSETNVQFYQCSLTLISV